SAKAREHRDTPGLLAPDPRQGNFIPLQSHLWGWILYRNKEEGWQHLQCGTASIMPEKHALKNKVRT
ncbi:MAG: hypothetical protein IJB41_08910, partial [Clostridia bacterium]|nr:hypothetical protein [Clostridia bacterium]